jgi:hypothetical protein
LNISTIQLFNQLTNEDFIAIHEAGKLKDLCIALSIDLQPKYIEKDKDFIA